MTAGHAPHSCLFSVNVRYSSLAERFSARPNQFGQHHPPQRYPLNAHHKPSNWELYLFGNPEVKFHTLKLQV